MSATPAEKRAAVAKLSLLAGIAKDELGWTMGQPEFARKVLRALERAYEAGRGGGAEWTTTPETPSANAQGTSKEGPPARSGPQGRRDG